MAKYFARVIMSTCTDIEVEANNEREARALAFETANPFDCEDWFYNIDCVHRSDDGEDEDEEEEE